jgi:hypothetical protein
VARTHRLFRPAQQPDRSNPVMRSFHRHPPPRNMHVPRRRVTCGGGVTRTWRRLRTTLSTGGRRLPHHPRSRPSSAAAPRTEQVQLPLLPLPSTEKLRGRRDSPRREPPGNRPWWREGETGIRIRSRAPPQEEGPISPPSGHPPPFHSAVSTATAARASFSRRRASCSTCGRPVPRRDTGTSRG